MRREAAGDGLQPQRPLVADKRKVRGRLGDDNCACVPEDIAHPGQMIGALAPSLLAGGDDQHHPRAGLQFPRQPDCGDHEGGNAALHVASAAAIELAVGDIRGERVGAPGCRTQGNCIDVAGKAQWLRIGGTADACDQTCPSFRELVVGDSEPGVLQKAAQVLGAG